MAEQKKQQQPQQNQQGPQNQPQQQNQQEQQGQKGGQSSEKGNQIEQKAAQGKDTITKVTQNIATLLERVLSEGLTVNGLIGIQGLTITSVDKAKELGILPAGSQGNQVMGQKGGQAGQGSKEEIDSLRQEVEQLKNMLGQKGGQTTGQQPQQNQSSQQEGQQEQQPQQNQPSQNK